MLLTILYLRPEGIIRERSSLTLPRKLLNKIAKSKGAAGAGQGPEKPGAFGRVRGKLRRSGKGGAGEGGGPAPGGT